MRERLAIIDGIRTPFCKAGSVLAGYSADDLGAMAIRELMARTGFDARRLDECIVGNVSQPVDAANVARVIALKAGLPQSLIASTVHRNCASGMEAITTAAIRVNAGEGSAFVCAGTESMSNIPLYMGRKLTELFGRLMKTKTVWQRLGVWSGFRPSMLAPVIGVQLGLTDPVVNLLMGQTAEIVAREFGISRQEQDAFALASHQKASAATKAGHFKAEIMPVAIPRKFEAVQAEDDGIRHEQTMEMLAKLKPFFDKAAGTVTVGNSSQLTDGAGALLVMGESQAKAEGLKPLGYLRDFAYAGLDPRRMGLGPVFSTSKLMAKTGLAVKDFDLVELNEAFAAQVLGCTRAFASDEFARKELGRDARLGEIDPARLNVNGGGIALGHPVGATGARLVIAILRELRRRGLHRGLATLCVGGGQGASLALEVE
jgi:acetyl-CoA C-acetyltransferase/acetyl-CoA acyltransferase